MLIISYLPFLSREIKITGPGPSSSIRACAEEGILYAMAHHAKSAILNTDFIFFIIRVYNKNISLTTRGGKKGLSILEKPMLFYLFRGVKKGMAL